MSLSPLEGLRILDFTRILAGPFCTMVLGDLGAEVFKIERPGTGDDTRQWYPPKVGNESSYFLSVNRNKKSIVIDLKQPAGAELAKQTTALLIKQCLADLREVETNLYSGNIKYRLLSLYAKLAKNLGCYSIKLICKKTCCDILCALTCLCVNEMNEFHPRLLAIVALSFPSSFKLALKSDVLVENFLPGTMDRMGLGFQHLKELAPRLIYCSITGFGQEGPYREKGGYDVIAAAIGGLLHITGSQDGEPCKSGIALTDLMTALYAHGAILTALLHREKTGQGQRIDVDLLSTQIASLVNIGSNYLTAGREAQRWGTAHESIVPYQAFETSDDKWFVIGATTNKQFAQLAQLIQLPQLAQDPRYSDNSLRVKNRIPLLDTLQKRFLELPLDEWVECFKDSSLPTGPVNSIEQAFSDPQVKFKKMVSEYDHPSAGRIKLTNPPVSYSSIINSVRRSPPVLGADTRHVLSSVLDVSNATLDELISQKIIQCG